jgi:nitroreductase
MENQKQIFSKPITDIIKNRISIRSYKKEPLTADIKKKLTNYLAQLKGPFNAKCRFTLIDSSTIKDTTNIKLGTYGVINGASNFLVSAIEAGDMNLEELGYEFEEFVLYAASLGIGTCWLGGTFKKGEFAKAIDLKEGELLPTISPVGYPNESKNVLGSLIRFAAGSKNRKPWEELFFEGSFDKKIDRANLGTYENAIEMVRLAPSASNKQPWRILKENDVFHFYLAHNKGYGSALGYDIQRIDMGIAMCHFELTCKELGLKGTWKKLDTNIKSPNDLTEYIISWKTL